MRVYQLFKSFSKLERQLFLSALIIFIASSLSWGASYFYQNTVKVPVASAQYAEGIVGQPIFLNPILSGANDADRDLSEVIFSDLLDLTDHYEISKDGKIWNIFLKPELLWDDGEPLASDDVIFTLETIQDPETRSPLLLTWQGVVAERVSELEIEFTLRTPYAFFLNNLKDLKIIPKHIFGTIPAANARLSNYNLEPVGSGPYKFQSYEKRKDGFITEYNFEINKNYALEKPFIKNLTVKFFPDSTELIKAFNSRRIDGFGDLNPKNLDDLKLNRQIIEINLPRYYAVFFNANSHPALESKTVKSALTAATNKKELVEKALNGKAAVLDSPMPPAISDNPSGLEKIEFNPETTNQLLDKDGWVKNSDGVREKKIGKNAVKLEFDLVVPQIPFLEETAGIMKESWQNIGVKLNLIVLNPSDVINEVIKTRNYQMILFGNILKLSPDLFSFWHSSERFYPGLNLSLYANKKADSLLEAVRKNFDDQSRKSELSQLLQTINSDQPAIFLYSPTYLYAAPKSFGGLEEKALATPSDRFENVNKWYLKTARVFK